MTDPSASAECFVCAKHRLGDAVEGGVIHADELLYAGHCHLLGRPDILLGWVVVEPRRHVAELGDLTEAEAAGLGLLVSRLAHGLQVSEGAEHVYSFVMGDGLAAGHLHVHLVPRYPGTPPEFRGLRTTEWPQAPRGGPAQTAEVVDRLRRHLQP